MQMWERVRSFQGEGEEGQKLGTLMWWEHMVKPGIKKLALDRTKELNKSKKEELNLFLITQAYLTKKLQQGQQSRLGELKKIHLLIERWYRKESEKIQHQSRVMEFQHSEKTTIYHHELHKRIMKKGSILRLQTDSGILEGHVKSF